MDKKARYLFYFLFSFSFILLLLNINSVVVNIKLLLSFIFNPNVVSKSILRLESIPSRAQLIFTCNEELVKLQNELSLLRQKIAVLEPLAEEAEKLRRNLGFEGFKNMKGIYAAVISYNPYDLYSFVYINRGSNDGVSLYNPVLYFDQSLKRWRIIGRVTDLYPSYSKVSLITSPGFSFVVMTSKSKGLAVSEGDGRILYKFIDGEFEDKESVFTADTSYTFPSSIYIGDIVEAKKGVDPLDRRARISFVNISKLRYVYVLDWQPYLIKDKI